MGMTDESLMLAFACSYPETRGLAIEDAPRVFRKHWFWKRYALLGFETETVSHFPTTSTRDHLGRGFYKACLCSKGSTKKSVLTKTCNTNIEAASLAQSQVLQKKFAAQGEPHLPLHFATSDFFFSL